MAEILVDEGLDHILAMFPKNGTTDATLYLGLFTSQTAATVPARTATGGAVPVGWTEAAGVGYARQSIAAASWGALATVGNGRETAAAEVAFSTVGAGINWGTANGFFIATASASAPGDVVIYFSNFDAGLARALVEGVTEKVTPRIRMDG